MGPTIVPGSSWYIRAGALPFESNFRALCPVGADRANVHPVIVLSAGSIDQAVVQGDERNAEAPRRIGQDHGLAIQEHKSVVRAGMPSSAPAGHPIGACRRTAARRLVVKGEDGNAVAQRGDALGGGRVGAAHPAAEARGRMDGDHRFNAKAVWGLLQTGRRRRAERGYPTVASEKRGPTQHVDPQIGE